MSALDAVKVLARYVTTAFAANNDAIFFCMDFDLLAGEPWDFGGEHEGSGRFGQVDWRIPARCVGPDDLTELFVPGEKIAERIPASVRHKKS